MINKNTTKYFKVICERGHCGARHSLDIAFYIKAMNAADALFKARKMPAVKHSKMPPYVKEVTLREFNENNKVSAYRKCEGNI